MLSERNYMGKPGTGAERVHTTKVTTPPGVVPPAPAASPASPDQPGLTQFNFSHPTLPATISVTVLATPATARGLAYLTAEEFCARIIGQIKAT